MSELALVITLFLLVVLSVWHAWVKGASFEDDVSNVAVWVLSMSVGGIMLVVITPLYHWIYFQRIWLELPSSIATYALAVLAYDFLYYWFHRASHRYRLLWSVHSVHHQSKRLVPSLGVRSSVFDFAVIWIILGAMFWLGFSSDMIVFSVATHGLYQLFLHNEWNIRFGIFEWILNTPSHHRLHHATNPEYIDKNFGSVFIVWDRFFGTFAEQQSNPKIGILGMNAWKSPLKSNLLPWFTVLAKEGEDKLSLVGMILISVAIVVSLLALLMQWSIEIATLILLVALLASDIISIKKHKAES
ncbi:sterol desaturase family protein [Bermanella marisrubri]|uniref:Fatty acid hydroxylase domain-containing protein n=1 Tax=Bermanella marisrubri TaxID=207949 RepID=Q1MYA5_9GAMM|nr:sterol desaturase family protein [Bermanella marisrubri]EAT10962.1 hypothetical protein RED65_03065 [Oceanobacter sp. RED65] [Bermanella marisrubri]QIZ85109.1 sterol desaturase family protein [Bermanella marisrubri]